MSSLLAVILILVVGTMATLGVARWRAELAGWVAVGTTVLALGGWLVGAGSVPGEIPLVAWGEGFVWLWRVDAATWQVGLFFLLLGLMGTWLLAGGAVSRGVPPAGTLLLALATGLVGIGGGSLTGLLAGWAILSGGWVLLVGQGDPAGKLKRLGQLWVGLLFVMLALASLPTQELGRGLDMSAWPSLAAGWILLAVMAQLGTFPFHGWRNPQPPTSNLQSPISNLQPPISNPQSPISNPQSPISNPQPPISFAFHLFPAGAGALLLMKLVETSDVGQGFALPVTLLGLVGLVVAIHRAWSAGDDPGRVAQALVLGQTTFILLAGVWAGADAALAETHVLLLAGGVFLVSQWVSGQTRLALILAVAALAGLPFTAGFAGRTALYNAWLEAGRFPLVLVMALLHIPLILVMIRQILPFVGEARPTRRDLLPLAGLILPLVGLVSLAGLGQAQVVSWLMVLFPAGVAIALGWFSRQVTVEDLREAFRPGDTLTTAQTGLRNALTVVATAVREAATILEGEGGMVWLLVLLVVFWLARA